MRVITNEPAITVSSQRRRVTADGLSIVYSTIVEFTIVKLTIDKMKIVWYNGRGERESDE